jgi:glycosyltransferase involved in cell wall biosynthesis
MPKLSIITINLNNPAGLLRTLESVKNQTYANYEWIIIDGGSASADITILNQNSDHFKYWISEPDSGIYNALNKGISKASGEYCFFLNSGDYFSNNMVLENVFCTELHEDIIFGNLLVTLNNKLIGKSRGKNKLSFLDLYNGIIKHQAAFIRRSLFDKQGLYNEELKIVADWEFFLKTIGTCGASYKYLDLDISYFDNEGISNKNEPLVLQERNYVIDKYLLPIMHEDYELLHKIGNYEIVANYKLPSLVMRIMAKALKKLEQLKKNR